MLAWLMANWQGVVLAALAIDKALEKLFPKSTILGKIDAALSGVAPKA